MSYFGRRQQREATIDGPFPPERSGRPVGSVSVTNTTAMRHSAVWACLDLRAGLMSTFPLDVYRNFNGVRVEMPKPPVLVAPGGEHWDYIDWMYATQIDLDRTGNTIGLITEINALGLPARIDLQSIDVCSVFKRRNMPRHKYRIDGKEYEPEKVWHERQYVVAGLPVGLSPIAHAAWSIGEALSMQDFALRWFGAGGVPNAHIRNTRKTVSPTEATTVRARWKATVEVGEPVVTGVDWEYNPIQAEAMGIEWLEGRRWSIPEICRFFGGSADLIDGTVAGQSVTYANITERHLQYLILKLGPATIRREKNLNKLLPRPRYVKLNTDALLRMDPKTRGEMLDAAIKSRRMTVTEARALDDLPPLTPEQEDEFVRLFGAPRQPGQGEQNRAAVERGDDIDDMWTPIHAEATVGRPVSEVEGR